MTEENSASIEIVANPDFISWKYPPYCKLCNVYFPGESCSEKHFEGRNHRNRLQTWKKHHNLEDLSSTNVLCNICWKEMNTQIIFDIHCKSPAHLKEDKRRLIIQKLKEEYRQLKELNKT